MLEDILLVLIALSWCYWIIAYLMVRSFFFEQNKAEETYLPPVSILKPVRGLDYQAIDNFISFCIQDYPVYEILFGVADPEDPVIPAVQRLQQDYPRIQIRLIVAPIFGANQKACILHHLATQASNDILVISDSDVRVTPDYLQRVVSPLADPRIGLVTCTYRGILPLSLAARFEALHMGVHFLPSVMVARKVISMGFALGASIALRGSDLARVGGFAVLSDYLADDYQIGARIAALGLRVWLSDYIVTIALGDTGFRDEWNREVRWARCTRISRPIGYPGLLLSFSTPLALISSLNSDYAFSILLISILLRWALAWEITLHTGDQASRQAILWLPVRDILSALVWVVGGIGKRVVWREDAFLVRADGRMTAVGADQTRPIWMGGNRSS
jgi:ceramide glucosyltransferase